MSGDPSWASVGLLVINDNKANTTTSFADQSPSAHTMTANGGVQYSTAQAPTGMTSSMAVSAAGDWLSTPDHTDFDFAAGDFTVEGFSRFTNVVGNKMQYCKRTNGSTFASVLVLALGGSLGWWASSNGTSWDIANNSPVGTVSAATWYHWAVTRSGSTWRAFLAGTVNATTVTSSATLTNGGVAPVRIGSDSDGFVHVGHIACVRVTKGVARYTANFTPPSLPLPTSAGVSMPMPLMRQMVH